jgi:hypothetical protein
MRLCSKLDCPDREGKGYKCLKTTFECVGEYTEAMLRSANVGEKDIESMKELGLLVRE